MVCIYGSAVLLLDLGCFFSFLILYTVGRTPWTGDQPVASSLPTHRTTQTQNKRRQTSMPRVGFEPTIPAFERAKAVHASDRAVTAIGPLQAYIRKIFLRSARSACLAFCSILKMETAYCSETSIKWYLSMAL
jgi:hypothetical protein